MEKLRELIVNKLSVYFSVSNTEIDVVLQKVIDGRRDCVPVARTPVPAPTAPVAPAPSAAEPGPAGAANPALANWQRYGGGRAAEPPPSQRKRPRDAEESDEDAPPVEKHVSL